jgi:caffeoyl-CoA O-methyltransferase
VDLTQYIEKLYGGEDELLAQMRREAEAEGIPAIQVPFAVGQLLQVLIAASGARRVLEIGTLFGYSAVFMGRALRDGGSMLCLEVSEKHADVSRRNLARAGLQDRVEVRLGTASQLLSTLSSQTFDFIFVDADKPGYLEYLEWAIKLSHSGTVIAADNVWRGGGVASGADENAAAMDRFNHAVAEDSRLISTIVPRPDCSDALSVSVVRGI